MKQQCCIRKVLLLQNDLEYSLDHLIYNKGGQTVVLQMFLDYSFQREGAVFRRVRTVFSYMSVDDAPALIA